MSLFFWLFVITLNTLKPHLWEGNRFRICFTLCWTEYRFSGNWRYSLFDRLSVNRGSI